MNCNDEEEEEEEYFSANDDINEGMPLMPGTIEASYISALVDL